MHELCQPIPGAIDTAFHSADGAVANKRRFLIRETFGGDQKQSFSLVVWKCGNRGQHILEIDLFLLTRTYRQLGSQSVVGIFNLLPLFSERGKMIISQNCKQPGFQVCSGLKRILLCPSLQKGLLN